MQSSEGGTPTLASFRRLRKKKKKRSRVAIASYVNTQKIGIVKVNLTQVAISIKHDHIQSNLANKRPSVYMHACTI